MQSEIFQAFICDNWDANGYENLLHNNLIFRVSPVWCKNNQKYYWSVKSAY